jgi:hypothetical protein
MALVLLMTSKGSTSRWQTTQPAAVILMSYLLTVAGCGSIRVSIDEVESRVGASTVYDLDPKPVCCHAGTPSRERG